MHFKLFFFISLFCFTSVAQASNQESSSNLKNVERKLTSQKAEASAIEAKEEKTKKDLGSLQHRLIQATAALRKKEKEKNTLEDQTRLLEREVMRRKDLFAQTEQRLTEIAEAFLKISRQPPESFLFKDAGTTDHIHRSLLFRSLLPKLHYESKNLEEELSKLEDLKKQTARQRALVDKTQKTLENQRGDLDKMISTRQGLLKETAAERAAIKRRLEKLSSEAQNLRQLLSKVTKASNPLPSSMKKQRTSSKNYLHIPVEGRLLRSYGEKDSYGVASEGLSFLVSKGSPITAPDQGRVVFMGSFRGYGEIVILQHKDGQHSFLAGFGRIDTNMNQMVKAGEPLGIMPKNSAEPNGLTELYFEWRDQGEPSRPPFDLSSVQRTS